MTTDYIDELAKLCATLPPDGRYLVSKAEISLRRINELRSNVVATQSASWSNLMYPLVAILNNAGIKLIKDVSEEQKEEHLACYGGAGGMPHAPVKP